MEPQLHNERVASPIHHAVSTNRTGDFPSGQWHAAVGGVACAPYGTQREIPSHRRISSVDPSSSQEQGRQFITQFERSAQQANFVDLVGSVGHRSIHCKEKQSRRRQTSARAESNENDGNERG